MAIIIPLICFVALFLNIGVAVFPAAGKKESLLFSVLIFSTILVIITELLSSVKLLNFQWILISWIIVLIVNLINLWRNRQKVTVFVEDLTQASRKALSGLALFEKLMLLSAALILTLIFCQGLLYPPNNWDAMTYHMARIASWVSHQSLSYYPTHIIRQLYQPPFAEYVILHVNVLNRSDLFSNSIQFVFLLFSIVCLLLIIESIGLNRRYKIIGVILTFTIPEIILQAASTQNDIVVAFFIITAFYFTIKSIGTCNLKYFVFTGLSVGLGLLTKGTAYLYFAPILLLWGFRVLWVLFKTKNLNYIWFPALTVLLFVMINAGHYARNYHLTRNVLGVDKQESKSYSNQKVGVGILALAIIKNAGLHTGFMYVPAAANFSDKVVYKLHAVSGIDINDPALNYHHSIYSAKNPTTDEDSAPNPIHFLLITVAVIALLFSVRKNPVSVNILLCIIILQVILFCCYLKWQPWNSRLHTPVFLLAVPLITYAIGNHSLFRKTFQIITPVIIVYALLVVLHNGKRPFSGALFYPRYQKYFMGKPAFYLDYRTVQNQIEQSNYKNIGLITGEDDWVYPLFSNCFNRETNPVYIKVNNLTKSLTTDSANVDCILNTLTNSAFITYNGKRYYNQDVHNKTIWLYK